MDKNRPVLEYYISIIISTLCVVVGFFSAAMFIISFYMDPLKFLHLGASSGGFNTKVADKTPVIEQIIWATLTAICALGYPFITGKRQSLRDRVEYDDDGVSYKKGKFSQLSKEQREQIDAQIMMDNERILSANQLRSITKHISEDPDKELENLIGLTKVKLEIEKLRARMEYELLRSNKNKKKSKKNETISTGSTMHMVFYGRPGTGKTTIARIMASYLYKYHFVKKDTYIEIDGNFFNGLSTGEASKKVTMLIKAAKGGVIFIDEAYSLLTGGQEVVATIVKCMEDDLSTVFIFAGYEKEMKMFVASNPGIESRVKYHLHFPDYNYNELRQIFVTMANEYDLVPTNELTDMAIMNIDHRRKDPHFGNAREVRNILSTIIDKHAYNLSKGIITTNDTYRLVSEDMI